MLGGTHLLIGFMTGAAVATHLHLPVTTPLAVVLGAAMVGSLLPDIDHAGSTVSRRLGLLALPVRFLARLRLLGHRGFTHSLLAVALLILVLNALHADYALSTAFVGGYSSHLVADALTPRGIRLWFPLRYGFQVPRLLAIKTGSNWEMLVALICLFVSIGLVRAL